MRKTDRETPALDGMLLFDKPTGPTSHDVVARVRRRSGTRRVGHTGTLDPMASGLLVLVLGRATRLARFLPAEPKRYTGVIRFGLTTDTDDVTGDPLTRFDGPPPSPDRVRAEARTWTGRFAQIPPAVSARKVGGRRMYRLARAGIAVEASPREVHVARFDLTPAERPGDWNFEAEVSSGTYIRSLARDLGRSLGCGGALAALRRESIGPFDVAHGLSAPVLDDLNERAIREAVVPLDRLPLDAPRIVLAEEERATRFRGGCAVTHLLDRPATTCAVFSGTGELLGVGRVDGEALRPVVVVRPLSGG